MKTTIKYLYILILISAPLIFGTTGTWARLLISFVIFLCATLFFKEMWASHGKLVEVPGLLPLLAFGSVILFQIMPLPAFVVKLISPATYTLYQDTAGLLGPVKWMHLTVDYKATVLQLIQFCAYVLFYLLTVQLLSEAEFLRRVVTVLLWYGLILALLSLLDHFFMPEKLLWTRNSPWQFSFGPYANHNLYGGLMVMLFPVTFFMMLYNKPRISNTGLRARMNAFFGHFSTNFYLILMLAALLIGGSLFASLSRGGIISLSLALLFVGSFLANRKIIQRHRKMSATILVGVILLSLGGFGWEPVFARFDALRQHKAELNAIRLSARQASMSIVRFYPLFGTGAGTFSHADKAYGRTDFQPVLSEYAYNDYMQIAAEQGILGLGCFAAFIITLFGSVKQFQKRKDPYCVYLFCGAVTGLTAILFFSFAAPQLQNGANAIYFFFLGGLCVAAAHTRMRSTRRPTFLNTIEQRWYEKVIGSVAVFLFFWGTALFGGACLGELHLNNLPAYFIAPPLSAPDSPNDDVCKTVVKRASRAMFYDPLESLNLIVLANAQSALMATDENVLNLLNRACRLTPLSSDNLLAAAKYFSNNGQFTLARKFYRAALKYEPANALIRAEYGCWLMAQGFLKNGVKEMQAAIALSPGRTQKFVGKMAQLSLSYDEIVNAMPPTVEPFLELGEYLVKARQKEPALKAYRHAAKNLADEKTIQASWIVRLCNFYMEQNLSEDAFEIASLGIKHLPRDSQVRYTMGTIYETMGVPYRAAKEYELAVVLDPKNISALKRLESIQDPS